MDLGKKIHRLRKGRGMSQEELASQLTVSRQAISKWELGESVPDTDNIVQLSRLFRVSTDYLLFDEYDNDADIPAVRANGDTPKATYRTKLFGYLGISLYAMASIWYIASRMMVHGKFMGFSLLWLNLHSNLSAALIPIVITVVFFRLMKTFPAQAKAAPRLNLMLSVVLMLLPAVPAAMIIDKLYYVPCAFIVASAIPVILYSSSSYYHSPSATATLMLINGWLQTMAKVFNAIIVCTLVSVLAYFLFFNLTPLNPALYLLLNCIPYMPFAMYARAKAKRSR